MSLNGNSNEEKIWNFLSNKGLNDFGIAGLMGNIYAESGLIPTNLQNTYERSLGYSDMEYTKAVDNGSYTNFVKDAAGYGLCQWTYWSRKQNLLNYAKSKSKSIGDLEMQLDFLYKELSENYSSILSVLKNATSILQASNEVLTKFERPADQSDSVKTKRASYGQVYYDKFHKSSEQGGNVMSNTVDKVITIAKAEVGYLEKSASAYKKNPAILDKKTDGAGSDNYTKYGRDMHKVYPAVMDFPAYWCDAFVDWCFYKAYGVTTAKSLLAGNFDDYTVASASMYNKKGAWHKASETPKVGDQIFFVKSGTSQEIKNICHTGLVYKVTSSRVYTIEGNTSGASGVVANGGGVAYKDYPLNYARIAGYGRPKYDVSTSTPEIPVKPVKPSKPTKKVTAKDGADKYSKSLAGTYTTTANLNIRSGAGTSKAILVTIPKGTKVTCYGYYTPVSNTKWLYIQFTYKDVLYTGFASGAYLKK